MSTPTQQPEYTNKTLEFFVCPTPGCDDYFGHNGMKDLGAIFTGPKIEDRPELQRTTGSTMRHSRAECPSCRERDHIQVERVRMSWVVQVPTSGPPTPELPPYFPQVGSELTIPTQ